MLLGVVKFLCVLQVYANLMPRANYGGSNLDTVLSHYIVDRQYMISPAFPWAVDLILVYLCLLWALDRHVHAIEYINPLVSPLLLRVSHCISSICLIYMYRQLRSDRDTNRSTICRVEDLYISIVPVMHESSPYHDCVGVFFFYIGKTHDINRSMRVG